MTDRQEGFDDLDRTLVDGLHREVEGIEADDALLERIERSARTNTRRAGSRGNWWLAGVAAASIVAGLLWIGADRGGDAGLVTDDVVGETDDRSTDTTTSTDESEIDRTATSEATSPTDAPGPLPAPDRAVVARVAPDGLSEELLLVDLADGSVSATIDTIDNSECDEIAACYTSYVSTAVGADRSLFVETCCEPAGGNVLRYPTVDSSAATASRERVSYLVGYAPAVDPSGTRVAAAGQTAITIRPTDGGETAATIPLVEDGTMIGTVLPTGLAWSPDGKELAVSLEDHEAGGSRIVVVPADGSVPVYDGRVVTVAPDRQSLQTWTTNGRLWVTDDDEGSSPSRVRAVDARTGHQTIFDTAAHQVVADRNGMYLYVVTSDGLWRADEDAVRPEGLLSSSRWEFGGGTLRAVSVFRVG